MEKKNNDPVEIWLHLEVGLLLYYDNFCENGFETMDLIMDIDNKEELKEIGIFSEEHQNKIMREINKLKAEKFGGNHLFVPNNFLQSTAESDAENQGMEGKTTTTTTTTKSTNDARTSFAMPANINGDAANDDQQL